MAATMMMKPLIVLAAIASAGAATSVAVLEFGSKKGSVRRTVSSHNVDTTAAGVTSFFNALHRNRRSLQQSGMPLVPDLFTRADLGIVLALRGDGVNLDRMSVVSNLLDEDSAGKKAVVGHMDMEGSKCHALMGKVDDVKSAASASEMVSAVKAQTEAKKGLLVGVDTEVTAANARDVDQGVGELMQNLQEWAESTGKTIVLHLVVEEEGGPSRRRSRSLAAAAKASSTASSSTSSSEAKHQSTPGRRRLEDEKAGEQNANGNGNSGYYGYGYYNAYGEWVTPYKTMFQIQYFNVVLWTALGLVAALIFVVYLMLYMPLEPDTLLFGESAKLVGSD